jgi:outer membrane lipoprotein-sorting protein
MASGPVHFHPSQKGGARMRFALLAALMPAFAVQGNDAEKLFREMEKKLVEAKSLRMASDLDVKDKREGGTLKSTVVLAQGNKLRLTMKGKGGGKELDMEITSDGDKLHARVTPPGESKNEAVPKNLHALVSKLITRTGSVGAFFLVYGRGGPGAPKDLDPEMLFKVRDFKMGEAAKVNGRDAKVLHYQIDIEGKESAKITLWLDARTLLPLKRMIVPEEKGKDTQITETYTEFTLNPKLYAKTFELPK